MPRWVISALLTTFGHLLEQGVVFLEPLLKLVKRSGPDVLVIDDTTNPKYGLKERDEPKLMGYNLSHDPHK